MVVELLVRGLALGGVYGLIAVTMNVIHASTNVINFAQGDVMVGAAMFAIMLHQLGIPLWIAVSVAVTVLIGFGILKERIVMPPLSRFGRAETWVITTVGIGVALRSLMQILWGARAETLPAFFPFEVVQLGPIRLASQYLVVGAACLVITLGLELFYRRHIFGKAMMAVSQDPLSANLRGIEVQRVHRFAFALGVGLAALTGCIVVPITFVQPSLGMRFVLKGFVAQALGGMDHNLGALTGGLLLGVAEVIGVRMTSASYQDTVALLILLVALLLRPKGLFGRTTIREV